MRGYSRKNSLLLECEQEHSSYYSMLQGRVRIQALIKIIQTLISLLYNHRFLQAEKNNGESNDEIHFHLLQKKQQNDI